MIVKYNIFNFYFLYKKVDKIKRILQLFGLFYDAIVHHHAYETLSGVVLRAIAIR